jgi:membrane carboxypeptidase/penicillin-binding protein
MSDLRELSSRTGVRDFFSTAFRLIKGILQLLIVFGTLGGTVVALLVVQEVMRLPDMSYLKNYKPVDSITIYDKNDKPI